MLKSLKRRKQRRIDSDRIAGQRSKWEALYRVGRISYEVYLEKMAVLELESDVLAVR